MENSFQDAIEKDLAKEHPITTFQSDNLHDKLILLNYEKHLLREMKMKPLHKFYFVKSTNPGEQFFMFTSICAWLLRKLGKNFQQPQEFDDPNQTINNIIHVLKELNIPTDFPSNKLLQGAGPICLFILDTLASQAIKISKRPNIKNEEEDEQAEYVDNDAEIILENFDDQQNEFFSDDSEDNAISLIGFNGNTENLPINLEEYKTDSLDDTENWRLELERVLPQLKVIVKPDPRDWRTHLEQMKNLKTTINSSFEDTKNQLGKMQSDITLTMDKIESRERHVNEVLSTNIKEYKNLSIELSRIKQDLNDIENDKENIRKELEDVINENEMVKSSMEQKGNAMSDGSPVIEMKKAIAKLKDEIAEINLEIGLLVHDQDQDIIRQAFAYAELELQSSNLTQTKLSY